MNKIDELKEKLTVGELEYISERTDIEFHGDNGGIKVVNSDA